MLQKDWSVVKLGKLLDPTEFVEPVPWERGSYGYVRPGIVTVENEETQVGGSYSRYGHPKFSEAHYKIKQVLETIMGEKLYPTYYFDRFYFKGNELKPHMDRGACEISVSYHISDNLDYQWPLYFTSPTVNKTEITCLPGDGVLYRGCELIHWREPMKGNHKSYFHQVFFHYVRADGHYLQYAYDQCK